MSKKIIIFNPADTPPPEIKILNKEYTKWESGNGYNEKTDGRFPDDELIIETDKEIPKGKFKFNGLFYEIQEKGDDETEPVNKDQDKDKIKNLREKIDNALITGEVKEILNEIIIFIESPQPTQSHKKLLFNLSNRLVKDDRGDKFIALTENLISSAAAHGKKLDERENEIKTRESAVLEKLKDYYENRDTWYIDLDLLKLQKIIPRELIEIHKKLIRECNNIREEKISFAVMLKKREEDLLEALEDLNTTQQQLKYTKELNNEQQTTIDDLRQVNQEIKNEKKEEIKQLMEEIKQLTKEKQKLEAELSEKPRIIRQED